MADNQSCEMLPWDSTFFNRRIARVRGDLLTPGLCRQIDEWAGENKVDLLYLLARSDDLPTAELAQANHFQLVDVRLTFERSLADALPPPPIRCNATIRQALPADRNVLVTLARGSHKVTRFYFDSHIARDKADDLYAAWMARDLNGDVLVAEQNGQVVGYVSFTYDAKIATGSIGITAVAASQRGGGIGRALMDRAMRSFHDRGTKRVTVVTQGRNIAAQRLYGRCGFIACNLQLYYHRWFIAEATQPNDAAANVGVDQSEPRTK